MLRREAVEAEAREVYAEFIGSEGTSDPASCSPCGPVEVETDEGETVEREQSNINSGEAGENFAYQSIHSMLQKLLHLPLFRKTLKWDDGFGDKLLTLRLSGDGSAMYRQKREEAKRSFISMHDVCYT